MLGHDPDPEGDMAFQQPDHQNSFSELFGLLDNIQAGAAVIGLASIVLLVIWSKWKPLKNSPVPAPLGVVLLGVGLNLAVPAARGRLGHPADAPRASAGRREPVGVLRLPAAARFLAVVEPGHLHRRA